MLPFKLVYHDRYDLRLGPHVFPSEKFRLIRDGLVAKGIADPADILAPEPASDEDILRVHTPEYVAKLKNDTLSATERMRLEIPRSKETVEAFWLAAGGSILAAQHAMRDGFAVNLGGGFHHAFPGHGEGFCMIHDVAVAIRRMQAEGAIRTRWLSIPMCTRETGPQRSSPTMTAFSRSRSIRGTITRCPSRPPTWTSISMTRRATTSISDCSERR